MSYVIPNTSSFISLKLTNLGRQKLASGQLNFSFYALGDSEINYDREEIVEANLSDVTLSGASYIFRPFDNQPNIKSFITNNLSEPLNVLTQSDIKVIKAIVNNEATERGFFSRTGTTFTTLTGSTYIKGTTTINNSSLTGGTTLLLGSASGVTRSQGDLMLIKLTNDRITGQTVNSNTLPIPHLWFKIQTNNATSVVVDRNLPNLSGNTGTTSQILFYNSAEVYSAFGTGDTTSYWNTGTLSFDSCCDVSCDDVPVWNMNQVWCEDLAGITGSSYEKYTKFGSYRYLGTKNPYLEYLCESSATTSNFNCNGTGVSYPDDISKSIAILHYTNNTISNFYGEQFYIDNTNNKTVKIHIPDLMYHRRDYSTSSGTTMGMTFLASGSTQLIGDSQIQYIDLIEDYTLIPSGETPLVIGKVFPQLKIVTIDDDEIVAAMSYKGNRNWTLPPLSATLSSPTGGTSNGILEVGDTMYITYMLDNQDYTGLTTSLPCQNYIKITNTTSSIKDVSFRIEDVDLLPYMRKIESVSYDGYGFYAHKFKVLYQIVSDIETRPSSDAWKIYDFTTNAITTNTNETINPVSLENQIPSTNGFVINSIINSGATTFNLIDILNLAPNVSPTNLQFGDERFFYGNLQTYIGATLYKTLIGLNINSSYFSLTTNPTRSTNPSTNPPNIKMSEIGIYDSNRDLVMIGKFNTPIKLNNGKSILVELSMDF